MCEKKNKNDREREVDGKKEVKKGESIEKLLQYR